MPNADIRFGMWCSGKVEGISEAVSPACWTAPPACAKLWVQKAHLLAADIRYSIRGHEAHPLDVDVRLVVSCSGKIEEALKRQPGVLDASVSLLTRKAEVCTRLPSPCRLPGAFCWLLLSVGRCCVCQDK